MTSQEQLLTALSEGRLTPKQVLDALLSKADSAAAPASAASTGALSALLTPGWKPWRNDDRSASADWQTLVVTCGSAEFALAGAAAASAHRIVTRKKRSERRFEDLAGRLLVWLQQVIEAHPAGKLRIVLIADPADVGVASGLGAMLKSAALEHPRLCALIVSVRADSPIDLDVLDGCVFSAVFKHDGGHLWIQDWQPVRTPQSGRHAWVDGATYLVTGGGGGLGRLFAREIAENAANVRIVLVGRQAPTPEIERLIATLQSIGAEALYRPLDIARAAEVRKLVQEIDTADKPLRGVLHCAGVVRDRHLVNKSVAELQAVLHPKSDGIVALDEATADLPLDLFVAFSSLAATFGNAGQCDYAAANGFMDEYIAQRHASVVEGVRRGRSISIDWPLWRDGGMRTDASIIAMTARNVGLKPIDNDAGIEAFHAALASGERHVMVLHGDLARLSGHPAQTSGTRSQVSTLRVSEPASAGAGIHDPARAPSRDASLLREKTIARLKAAFSKLTMVAAAQIDKDEPIDRYGIESVAVTALNAEFSAIFGPLSQTLLYEHRTLASLAEYFCSEHAAACRAWCGLSPSAAEDVDPAPPTMAPTAATRAGEPEVVLRSFRGRRPRAQATAAVAEVAQPAAAAVGVTPIAIIGISGRYPGARDLDAFWRALEAGQDCIAEIPAERWPADAFYHPEKGGEGSLGKYYCKWGGFIEGFAEFDPQFFGISPREAYDSDPQERLFLQCCWATIEDAGYTVARLRRQHDSSVGVFVGVTKTGFERYAPELWAQGDLTKPSTSFASIANRVSYLLDLHGPSMPVDTMCSASLTALHEACEHLARGECQLALAGGVNLYLHPSNFVELCAQGMLSVDGRCRSFGAGANGFVPGEGVGAVLLKPLSRAVEDGDQIHAVIRSTSINHGGRTNGYTVPNPRAQATLIRRALDRAGLDARSISYLEAHGTGTELGDPIEFNGLVQAFSGDRPRSGTCALGSLKSNIGHLEAAAGIAGLTKIVLQMRHRTLVPTLHCDPPNPKIDWSAAPFALQRESGAWRGVVDPAQPPTSAPVLRAGLSSFGAGGANAHLIVEAYRTPAGEVATDARGPWIFVLSARSKERLREYAAALRDALPRFEPSRLADIAYTLQIGREAMAERLAIVADSREALSAALQCHLDDRADADLYSGRAAPGGDPVVELSDDEDMASLLRQWIVQGRFAKVLGLWVKGLNVDWRLLLDTQGRRPVSLPTYPFERRSYWFELKPPQATVSATGRVAAADAAPSPTPGESAAGATALVGNLSLVPVWNTISPEESNALRQAATEDAGRGGLIVNADQAVIEAVRMRWSGAQALSVDAADTEGAIAERLAALGDPSRILWMLPAGRVDSLFDDALLDAQADGVRIGLRLIKALLMRGWGQRPLDLYVATAGTQRVFANRPVAPLHAGVHGLIASAAKEYPHWRVRLVDLDPAGHEPAGHEPAGHEPAGREPVEADSVQDDCIPELLALPPDARGRPWARRDRRWYRPTLVPVQGSTPDRPVYRDAGVYVLIGGAGHIGELWSEHLARNHRARIVWVGRRPLNADIEARMARVAQSGGEVHYVAADATDAQSLQDAANAIRSRFGAIHGVVHSALIMHPRSLADLGEDEFFEAMNAKFAVSVRMAQAFGNDALDFMLFFSSLISIVKNAGQSHYAAGCCAADAYAMALADHWRSSGGPRVKVMNWGYWNKAANLESEGFHLLEQIGIAAIEPADGLPAIDALLAGTHEQTGFVKINKPILIEGMSPQETIVRLAGHPALVETGEIARAMAATDTGAMIDSLPRGDAGLVERTHALEAALATLLGAELGAMAQAHGVTAMEALGAKIDPMYARWLQASAAILARNAEGDILRLASRREALWDDWQTLCDALDADDQGGLRARSRLAESALRQLPDILTGKRLATDVLFQDASMEGVGGIYRGHTVADYFNASVADAVVAYARLSGLGHRGADSAAGIRILEVGAGTGGTSGAVFARIAETGIAVAEYCYTDISRAFLMHAEDTFKPGAPYLACRLFDAEKTPADQGIVAGSYDLVIATNVLHATRDVRRTLRNVKATLRSGGMLLLNEMNTPSNLVTHLTFGLTKGWWLFEDDAVRVPGSPGLTPASWQDVLACEGFDDTVFPAAQAHHLGQQLIVARSDGAIRIGRARKARAEQAQAASGRAQATPAAIAAVPDRAALQAHVHDAIVDTLARSLRMDRDEIDSEESFADFGLDSIIGIGFVRELNAMLGIKLDTTVIFDYSTATRLTAHVLAEHGAALALPAAAADPLPAPTAEPQPAAMPRAERAATVKSATLQEARPEPVAGAAVETSMAVAGTRALRDPIAVIGLAGRFAGSEDVDALWAHLAQGHDLVTEVTRWDLSAYYARSAGVKGCRYGSFLDRIDLFDPMFFSISGLEASYMDPKQRIFLEECWKALEVAGYAGDAVQGLRCGVYVGNEPGDYNQVMSGPAPGQAMWGNASSVLPARIAYFLDLQGPAISVDTACSSSLVAVHLACQALWGGEIEMALAGGASVEATPGAYVGPSAAGMLSARGRCYTFDARADGFVPGEGVGVIVLKRLQDALAAGDSVHGLIRGSGLNQDGTTNGITAPSARSQERLECDVYDRFGIDPARIRMMEAHGTGTELGDPIEFNALVRSFRRYTDRTHFCAIGSIKTNLGHTKAAAGIAGVMKILLAFRHRQIPPSLHFETVNPNIDFDGSPFVVSTRLSAWERDHDGEGRPIPRCAAVSAFGMSGTNAHLVFEEAPDSPCAPIRDGACLVVLSAMSQPQLREAAQRLLAVLRSDRAIVCADLSHTLLMGRRHTEHRLATVVSGTQQLAQRLQAWLDGDTADVRTGYVGGKRRREDPELRRSGENGLHAFATLADEASRRERLETLAGLYVDGYRLDYGRLFAPGTVRRIPLPTYPFAADSYWVPDPPQATPVPAAAVTGSASAAERLHPLLHRSTGVESAPSYRSRFDGSEFYFADHVVNGRRLLPGAAHLELARAAWQHCIGASARDAVRIRHAAWVRPLAIAQGAVDADVVLVHDAEQGGARFEIASVGEGGRETHSQGHVEALPGATQPAIDLQALRSVCASEPLAREGYYAMYAALGVEYGPSHRGIEQVFVGDGEALARLHLPGCAEATADDFGLHPALLDAAFQATSALWLHGAAEVRLQPSVPFALDALDYFAPCPQRLWAWIRRSPGHADAAAAVRKLDIDLCDDAGRVCARLRGFSTRVLAAARADASKTLAPSLFRPQRRSAGDARETPWPRDCARVLVCFGMRQDQVDALAARLVGVDVRAVEARGVPASGSDAGAYARRAETLLDTLAGIVTSHPGSPLLLQVIVADGAATAIGLNAMLRTARLEQPRLSTQLLLASAPQSAETWAALLERPLPGRADAAILHPDGAQITQWVPLHPERPPANPWRTRGVYLITGGMGALGLLFARDIARRSDAATIVLTGRSAAGTQTAEALQTLAAQGARAVYRQADIGDPAQVAALTADIRRDFGRLDGILHSAGVVADRLIARKTRADLTAVFAPKILGVEALDAATAEMDLDLFVLFSSISGVMGSVGQADYAAANAYLDAFAAARNAAAAAGARRGRCISIDWPYWIEGGMRTDAGVQEDIRLRHGLHGLSSDAGLDAFHAVLSSDADQVLVLNGDPDRLNALVSHIGVLSDPVLPSATPTRSVAASASASASASQASDAVGGDALDYLKTRVAEVLRLPVERIDAYASMEKYGIDSIMVMSLTNALEEHFGSLSKTLFYEYQTIAELAEFFERNYGERLAALHTGVAGIMQTSTQDGDASTQAATGTPVAEIDVRVPEETSRDGIGAGALDVAIIGLSGRFPMADTLERFWENLVEGRDCITEVPQWRWEGIVAAGDANTRKRWGGFIDGVADFDPLFFGISPREALVLDPQERLFLQSACATLEHAGYTRRSLAASCERGVGVYVGVMYEEYPYFAVQAQLAGLPLAVTGSPASIANRVSYYCGFDGPSMAVDSMCSSSLTTIHLACQALALGDCDAALAGGVNISIHPNKYVLLEQGNFASSHGRCMSFGAGGDGYVPSEGVGAVLLKPLAKAERDGDRIHAVVRATGINHGGKTNGYTVPNPNAQARLIRRVLDRAGLTGADIDYVEAHGTGTSLGDPIEIAGLAKAFGDGAKAGSCLIGSVKSNIGHCESAAGIAAVCKVVLQMTHGVIAPSLHSQHPNPNIDLAATPFRVVQTPTPWKRRTTRKGGRRQTLPRMAGISSFGAGGANAHIIIGEYLGHPAPSADTPAQRHAFVFSARTADQLRARSRQMIDAIGSGRFQAEDLASIAYTLVVGREAMDWRLGVTAGSLDELARLLSAHLDGAPGSTAIAGSILEHESAREAFDQDPGARQSLQDAVDSRDLDRLIGWWRIGVAVPLAELYREAPPIRIGLPTYPFARQPYWFTPPAVAAVPKAAASTPAANVSRVLDAEPLDMQALQERHGAVDAAADRAASPGKPTGIRLQPAAPVAGVQTGERRNPGGVALSSPAGSVAANATSRTEAQAPAGAAVESGDVAGLGVLRAQLVESFAALLFMDAADVDARRSFGEMGMDSVLAVEWVRDLNKQYGIALEATELYDNADIRALARLVHGRLQGAVEPAAQAPAASPQTAAPVASTLASSATVPTLDVLRAQLVESFAALLFMDAADVDARRSFGEMGMDSVLAVEWVRDLNKQYGIALEATELYDNADIRALARLVHARLLGEGTPAAVVEAPPVATNPGQDDSAPGLEALRHELAESFAGLLFMDIADVDARRPFGEMGMDSVLAVEWVRDLNKQYGIALEATELYDNADIRALARLLRDRLRQPASGAGEAPARAEIASAATAATGARTPITGGDATVADDRGTGQEALRRDLARSFAEILFMEVADVDMRRPFGEMGMDSVLAVEWIRDLNKQYGIALEATELYDNADIRSLATLVAGRLAAGTPTQVAAAVPAARAMPAADTPSPAAPMPRSLDEILRLVRDGVIGIEEAERLMGDAI